MFKAMEQFIKVVECGSFSEAGKLLNKNASSIARQIDRLEHELGVQLFIRSTRRLELTSHGQSFYTQCIDILKSVDTARNSFSDVSPRMTGDLQINALDSFGMSHVVPLLPEFQARYPKIRVSLSLDNTVVDMHNSNFDLAIRLGRPVDSSLIYKPLLKNRYLLVASPDYLKNSNPILVPDDLKQQRCLTFFRHRQRTYWHFRNGEMTRKLQIDGVLSSCGGAALLEWAKQGVGITLSAHWMTEQALADGELVEVLPDWSCGKAQDEDSLVYLLWRAGASQNPALRAMIDFLYERLSDSTIAEVQSETAQIGA